MAATRREKREREEGRKYFTTPTTPLVSVSGGIYDILDSFRYTRSSASSRRLHFRTSSPLISKRWSENERQPEIQTKPFSCSISISPPTPSPFKPTRPTAHSPVKKPGKPRKQPKTVAAAAAAADTVTDAVTVTAPGQVGVVKKPRKPCKQPTAAAAATVKKKMRRSQLSAAEKTLEAYRRVPNDFNFKPPPSCHQLIQEKHAFDPWRVLVICILLNCTRGKQVKQVVNELFSFCTDAETTTKVDVNRIVDVIHTLGLHKRAETIKHFSEEYLKPDWTHVTSLPGIAKYAADAYAIFCTGKGADVRPNDHKLVDYWNCIYGNRHQV